MDPACLEYGLTDPERASALKSLGVPAELHVYVKGEHGFGVRQKGQPTDVWTEAGVSWLRGLGALKPGQ
jgi:hypothetical protein